jgi:hypothetical protein
MLIFDGFPSRALADAYAAWVIAKYERQACVYDSQEDSDAVDPFPFRLNPPIVLVDRLESDTVAHQARIEKSVKKFGGQFAGT